MEWEKKFFHIIQETESNLAKARQKLRGNGLNKDIHRDLELFGRTEQGYRSLRPSPVSCLSRNNSSSAFHDVVGGSMPLTSRPVGGTTALLDTPHTSEMGQLLTKIDSQNQVIERLERLVRTLNQEKDQYRRHIRDLQSEVGDISTRIGGSKYMDLHLETQVDLIQHQVRSDMRRLQNMISAVRNSSLDSEGITRSFKDMQLSVHAELEGLRRDLNMMTHRVGRLELDVSTHSVSQRDLHDRLSMSMLSAPYGSHLKQSSSFLPEPSSSLAPKGVSYAQDLSSTVQRLHEKLNSLESRLAAGHMSPPVESFHYSGLGRAAAQLYKLSPDTSSSNGSDHDASIDLDDLDLSDDLDLGLSDSEGDLSEDLDEIINARKSSQKGNMYSLAGSKLPSSTQLADDSTENTDLSDINLDNLDLSSACGSVDLDSVGGSSSNLKLGDL